MAYITAVQEFWGLAFAVAPGVLIPRPETEIIVEAALALFPAVDRPLRVADVCTGSGCLAVSLAVERPEWKLLAADISAAALRIAAKNAAAHGVAGRVALLRADLLPVRPQSLDLIVANPPYVAEDDRRSLPPEVVDYEPAIALFGGADGLEMIRRLLGRSAAALVKDGVLVFEFGAGQHEAVTSLVRDSEGLALKTIHADLQGIPRTAVIGKQ
jgi:release factor glutamine methyltransferase